MITLYESHVEDASLAWFKDLGYTIGHGPHMAPGKPAAERDSFGDVMVARGSARLERHDD